jgi:hypothetical protein
MGLAPSSKHSKKRVIVVIRKVKFDGPRVLHSCPSIYRAYPCRFDVVSVDIWSRASE